ncbi:dynactin subunit 2-like isoform X1 [Dreissena polymorpha]|uniref:dynactin subunit 2-like isoform X1 n=1 Tax=Dreissena polymorpha TaxID=45954 RepID=UPI002263F73F|nr:dynactin subunit 2-like isoform X1 [Dreissena polymorpha]
MADPKYAKLPGIDLNSPDVYETSDLPESEQNIPTVEQEEPNEDIEKVVLDSDAAFKKFKGKGVDGKDIDFSDKISAGRRTGYDAAVEYELGDEGTGKIETPQQKFQRLQHEIRELTEEVNKIKENVKSEAGDDKLSPVAMGKQLGYLQHQLTDLHLEKVLGPDVSVDLSDPQGALQKRLLTQLESFKPGQKTKGGAKEGVTSGDHVTYELFYRPEQAHFSRNAKLASLEERMERLEAALGNTSQDKLGLLTSDTDNKSLVGAVAVVNSKLSLLEPTNIEQVEVRLHSVLQKLDKIAEKKTAQESGETQSKVRQISELYTVVKKWEATADVLPKVVDRLSALKDLHEQVLQFSQDLAYLDTTQQEIQSSLKSHGDMFKKLEAVLNENLSTIKNNCASVESRVAALSK